jgi:glucosamine-6-phosphate deaminase
MLTLKQSPPITIVATPEIAARRVANIIICTINTNDNADRPTKIGFATGNTMIPLYKELVGEYKRGHVSFKNVVGVNLDEYTVDKNHPDSYHTYMQQHLYSHVDINPENIYLPNGGDSDISLACKEYETILEELGELDVQLLGIGVDGHIGFNEPPADKNSTVHIEKLDESTVAVNNPPSRYAITMGIANILNSKTIILIATGETKADIICKLLETEADNPLMPASYIKSHPHTTVICDWDAVSKVPLVRDEVNKMVKRGAMNAISEVFTVEKRITITSPHPDDDVIGVGGAMSRYSGDCKMSVIYQTTGRNAVSKSSLRHHDAFVKSIFKKPRISEKLIMMGIRRAEATIAAQLCGVDDVNFMEMPFYKRKRREKMPAHVEDNDVIAMMKIIEEKKPDILIINGDADPNLTHVHCKTAIIRALKRINKDTADLHTAPTGIDMTKTADMESLEIVEEFENANAPYIDDVSNNNNNNDNSGNTKIVVYEYCSAWGEFSLSDVDVIIPLTAEQMQIKEHAILAHESQNPPIAHNGVVTPFHERARTNARDAMLLLQKMGFDYSDRVVGIELLRKLDQY